MQLLPNALKKLISYIFPIHIQKIHSALSGMMSVDMVSGRYQLYTGNAIYSYEDKYTSYAAALKEAHFSNQDSALVLGLGLGSIPWILQTKHQHTGPITCIELDPVIIKLAAKFYPSAKAWKQIHVIRDDAVAFLANNKKTYGLIAMDLFVGDEIPYQCWDKEFLIHLKRAVAKEGTLLVSRLIDRRMEEESFWNNLEEIFPSAKEVRTNGNMIMIWKHANNH